MGVQTAKTMKKRHTNRMVEEKRKRRIVMM